MVSHSKQAIYTHDRIMLFTPGPLACVLCHKAMETHDHLFFGCSFSSFICQGLLHIMEISTPIFSWNSLVEWASLSSKKKKPQQIIAKMCLGLAVYTIWKERNARSFKLEAKSKENILQEISRQISTQIQIKYFVCIASSISYCGWMVAFLLFIF